MESRMLHIFRNTPIGRESLLQSRYFCQTLGLNLCVYVPRMKKFLMYFEFEALQVDLDASYLRDPESAASNVRAILGDMEAEIFESGDFSATNLPDVPTDYEYMCCPRAISDKQSMIGLGYIGSKVRKILRTAHFPILLPSGAFKEWKSVAVLYGGSENAAKAFRLGVKIARAGNMPVDMFSHVKAGDRQAVLDALEEQGLDGLRREHVRDWLVFEGGEFCDHLFDVPHDALVVLGAYGHGGIKGMMFGGTMEMVQSTLPNNLLVVGPEYAIHGA